MTRILYIVTVPQSARAFLRGQLSYLNQRGYETHVASSPNPETELIELAERENSYPHFTPLIREINIKQDLLSLLSTWKLIRQIRPEVTNVGTPKAGLIGGLAAMLAGVPARVYTLRGLRLETTRGTKRKLLTFMEKVACSCAHVVVCVSPSLKERAVHLGLVSADKAVVLSKGSSNGSDASRFLHSPAIIERATEIKRNLGISDNVPVIGFVGRFVKDKGIEELVTAFKHIYSLNNDTVLLLVGDYESGDPISSQIKETIETHPNIVKAGYVSDTAPYYHVMDVLAFPTYREGFPNAPLEAAAAAKPVVTTTATGAVDSVINGITGLIVPVGNGKLLADALFEIISNIPLSHRLGEAGKVRVLKEFQPQKIWSQLDDLYRSLLEESKLRKKSNIKRLLDVIISTSILVIASLPIVVISIVIRFKLGRPIIFKQVRPGLNAKSFTMYKFRTMSNAIGRNGQLLSDSERLTSIGRFLRNTSLDELPGLLNVLRGEMSLVGPRPLLMDYLELYTPEQARRHEMRPGVTGWAQVNGRNAISWEEKFRLDVWYVDNRSFWLDLQILWMTVQKVFKREGISAAGDATMPRFEGTNL